MKFWLQEVDRYGELDVKKLLVGNKYDLSDQRVVKEATGKVYICTRCKFTQRPHVVNCACVRVRTCTW